MGRTSLYGGVVFAVIGFISGVYVLSLGPFPDLPTPLVLILFPQRSSVY